MRLLIAILFLITLFSCKTIKHVTSTSLNVDSISYKHTVNTALQHIDTSKFIITSDDYNNEITIEYKQDSITHAPVIVSKTIKSKGVITTAKQDNHISVSVVKNDTIDSNRVVVNQQVNTKDVTRTNYTPMLIIVGVIIAIVVALKMILK